MFIRGHASEMAYLKRWLILKEHLHNALLVRDRGMDEARTQMQEVKRVLLITMINKTNKNYPIGEKQTSRLADWLDWTRQGRTGQGRTGHKT